MDTHIHFAICPICDAKVNIPEGSVVTEVISCLDCGSKLVISSIQGDVITLTAAPSVEEDWGE